MYFFNDDELWRFDLYVTFVLNFFVCVIFNVINHKSDIYFAAPQTDVLCKVILKHREMFVSLIEIKILCRRTSTSGFISVHFVYNF